MTIEPIVGFSFLPLDLLFFLYYAINIRDPWRITLEAAWRIPPPIPHRNLPTISPVAEIVQLGRQPSTKRPVDLCPGRSHKERTPTLTRSTTPARPRAARTTEASSAWRGAARSRQHLVFAGFLVLKISPSYFLKIFLTLLIVL
jgi:hypothetical protein